MIIFINYLQLWASIINKIIFHAKAKNKIKDVARIIPYSLYIRGIPRIPDPKIQLEICNKNLMSSIFSKHCKSQKHKNHDVQKERIKVQKKVLRRYKKELLRRYKKETLKKYLLGNQMKYVPLNTFTKEGWPTV